MRPTADLLEKTMRTLQRAQDELIGVGKNFASLGSLVAGMAHELNTPLGNALITASALHEMTERASEQALAGTLNTICVGVHAEHERRRRAHSQIVGAGRWS